MKARETMQLTNTLSSNNRNLTWVSTNSKIAVVSEGGVVTAVSEGYVSIYAYPNNDKQNVVHYYLNVSGIGEADYISRFIHVALEEIVSIIQAKYLVLRIFSQLNIQILLRIHSFVQTFSLISMLFLVRKTNELLL